MSQIAILAEGSFERINAKTAIGLLRYRRPDVVCVIDSSGRASVRSRGLPRAPTRRIEDE